MRRWLELNSWCAVSNFSAFSYQLLLSLIMRAQRIFLQLIFHVIYWPGLSNPGQVLSCLSFSEMGHFLAYGNRGFPEIPYYTSLIISYF